MRSAMLVLVLGLSAFAGCVLWNPDGRACTTLYAYGITVHVEDASGNLVTNATITLHEGSYTEVLQFLPTNDYAGAGERPGTYSMTIEVPGLPAKTVDDIVLGFDGCHVIGAAFEVQAEPNEITVHPITTD